MQQTEEYYLRHAHQTLNTIRAMLIYGSNAKSDEAITDYKRLYAVTARTISEQIRRQLGISAEAVRDSAAQRATYVHLRSLILKRYGYGHCGDIAASGFIDLVRKNVYPIEIVSTLEHDFLRLGYNPEQANSGVLLDIWANYVGLMSDLPRLQANNNYGLSFLPSVNAIHCMRGELTSYLRLATADEMLTFKEKMVLPSEVMSEFPDHTLTEAELRNDAVALRQFYNKARRIFQEHPLAQRNLSTLKNNIELLEQRLNQIKAPVLHSIFRPEGVLGWCDPPEGSFIEALGRTHLPGQEFKS